MLGWLILILKVPGLFFFVCSTKVSGKNIAACRDAFEKYKGNFHGQGPSGDKIRFLLMKADYNIRPATGNGTVIIQQERKEAIEKGIFLSHFYSRT